MYKGVGGWEGVAGVDGKLNIRLPLNSKTQVACMDWVGMNNNSYMTGPAIIDQVGT